MKHKLIITFLSFNVTFSIWYGCKKSNSGNPDSATPNNLSKKIITAVAISSFSPDSGALSALVTIQGKGFSSVVSEDTVRFNGILAKVTNASDSVIITEVPTGAGTGILTVKVGSLIGTSLKSFLYKQTVIVSTFAGNRTGAYRDGPSSSAEFNNPTGVAVDASGNVFVADWDNNRIRKITPDGIVSTLAGNGHYGFVDGPGSNAEFYAPSSVAVDVSGNLFVADQLNNRIRKISVDGTVSTIAGNGYYGYADGPGSTAEFEYPWGVAVDAIGNILVADYNNNLIRKITPNGAVSTLAGNGIQGYVDGTGSSAEFYYPAGVATDGKGNVLVADRGYGLIRKIVLDGTVSTYAGNVTGGFADGPNSGARFSIPFGVAVDARGNVFVADAGNNRIRKITPDGTVTTLAGSKNHNFADGPGHDAEFNSPLGVAVDARGNVFVADAGNNVIRKITIL